VLEAAKSHGLLVGKGGLYGNVIRLSPMLNITDDEIDEGVAALTAAVRDVA
jgi:4-aminobutyrate aminotransferase